jgi:LysM repeat protein
MLAALGSEALLGCQADPVVQRVSVQGLSEQVIRAGAGTAHKPAASNVVPSKAAPRQLVLAIEDERYLGDVARQLEVSVDAMMRLNGLSDTLLKPGMQIKTRAELIDRFVLRRERRKADKIAADEAKRQEKVRKEAEARAARRAKQIAGRARKKGIAVADGKIADLSQIPGTPLRPGQVRNHGAGIVRGVSLPASFGAATP